MCGGRVVPSPDMAYGTCDSCGRIGTLPKIDDEQKAGMFNRGNTLRMRGEFDKAAVVFERIIEQDETDAEAHWCLALCRYGIEYVEDPKNGERMPTCHRTSYDLFLNDVDYAAAIEHSDDYTAGLYTAEAKKITEIQKSILAISKQEEPFDVFICYKETTDGGSRTKDSTFAQEIYYELTSAGYHVFFSRITLEDKLGTEYEPYIFAALNSAKVMVVVGTSAENFNSVWVKNEWSRFLSIMKNDRSRMLIPCYRDMDPYDLPDELAMLQSQDMDKIGFIQDIIRGIKKVLESTMKKTAVEASPEVVSTATLERLIQNSDTYLKLGNYPAAQEVFSRITKEYPEDYRGWWGLIVCETKGLSVVPKDLSPLNTWFKYAKQLSTAEVFAPFEAEYVAYVRIAAEGDVDNELYEIYIILNNLNSSMETFMEQRKQMEQQKQQRPALFENQSRNADAAISEAQHNIDIKKKCKIQARQMGRSAKIVFGVGVLLLLVGIWWDGGYSYADNLISGGLRVVGIICGLIGFIMALATSGISDEKGFDERNRRAQSQLEIAEKAKVDNKNQYDRDMCAFDSKIAHINRKIQQIERGIDECEKYLSYGKDKMAEMFWAQRCKSIGIDQQFDVYTEQLRKAAWGNK